MTRESSLVTSRTVDCSDRRLHSAEVNRRDPVPTRLRFAVATALALSSTVQAWRLTVLSDERTWSLTVKLMGQLFVLNTAYWYVPALLAPIIIAATRRYRLGYTPW